MILHPLGLFVIYQAVSCYLNNCDNLCMAYQYIGVNPGTLYVGEIC